MAKKLPNAPSPFLLGTNRSSENPVWEELVITFCFGGNDKNLGEGFFAAMSKNEQIQVFDLQMYLSVILTLSTREGETP